MVENVHIPRGDNVTMFIQSTLFDRKGYREFIENFAHDIIGQSFIWLRIMGLKHAYKIKNNNELIHVLSYVYTSLIRDPLCLLVWVPVQPPLQLPTPETVVLDNPINFSVL